MFNDIYNYFRRLRWKIKKNIPRVLEISSWGQTLRIGKHPKSKSKIHVKKTASWGHGRDGYTINEKLIEGYRHDSKWWLNEARKEEKEVNELLRDYFKLGEEFEKYRINNISKFLNLYRNNLDGHKKEFEILGITYKKTKNNIIWKWTTDKSLLNDWSSERTYSFNNWLKNN